MHIYFLLYLCYMFRSEYFCTGFFFNIIMIQVLKSAFLKIILHDFASHIILSFSFSLS